MDIKEIKKKEKIDLCWRTKEAYFRLGNHGEHFEQMIFMVRPVEN